MRLLRMVSSTLGLHFNPGSLIAAVLVFGFFAIAGCGNNSSDVERCLENGSCVASLDVLKVSSEISLNPDAPFWDAPDGPKKISLELGPQMFTNPKWPDPAIKKISLSAARNGSDIAFPIPF